MPQEPKTSDEEVAVPEVVLERNEQMIVVRFETEEGERDFGILAFIKYDGHEFAALGPVEQLEKAGAEVDVKIFLCERPAQDRFNFHVLEKDVEVMLLEAFDLRNEAEDSGMDETVIFTRDVGNGEQEFCVVDFVDMEESVYAVSAPKEQFYDMESPEWDVYVFRYLVLEGGEIEVTAVDDEELRDRVVLEYERRCLVEDMSDLQMNPFNPDPVDA